MKKILIFLTVFIIIFFISLSGEVKAGASDNVSGWAWSENIGWISFNCTNQGTCGSIDYGVNIDPSTGNFSGYAWSENIGWIDFGPAGPYPASPNYSAKVNLNDGKVSGWARALAYDGGWDGWIKLQGPQYGVSVDLGNGEFSGFAWSDMVIGWISFRGSTYGVSASASLFSQPPLASISCDASDCDSTNCIAYTGCPFHLVNDSTDPDGQDDIVKSEWDILEWGVDPDLSCLSPGALCDYTPSFLSPGDYTVELYVEDQAGLSDTVTQFFQVKQEAVADFRCSLDNETWQDCEGFKATVEETVFFLDQSTPSEGAGSIISRSWIFQDGDPLEDSDNNLNPSTQFQSGGAKDVTLTITDDQGRGDSQTYTLNSQLPLPKWKEIPPIIWLREFLAGLNGYFRTFDGLLKLLF